jgi:NADPH:quinone reductase
MNIIQVTSTGGPEQLGYKEVVAPEPKAGEALVRNEAIGVNYIDVYHRSGVYPQAVPFIPGLEAAGTIVSLNSLAQDFQVGDRVGYVMTMGAYAQYTCVPVSNLVRLPAGIETRMGAAALLQGMTAHFLSGSTYPLQAKDTALIHAAAGGVGRLLVQMARARGARVIATVSTLEKANLAREAGANEVIFYEEQDFLTQVQYLTNGKGVQVVYDSVGKTTWQKSLECLAPRGMLVLYGQSSGLVPPIDPQELSRRGSLFVTRPTLMHHLLTREELDGRSGELFQWIQEGKLQVRIDKTFPLAEASDAHRYLQARKTTGKVLLLP